MRRRALLVLGLVALLLTLAYGILAARRYAMPDKSAFDQLHLDGAARWEVYQRFGPPAASRPWAEQRKGGWLETWDVRGGTCVVGFGPDEQIWMTGFDEAPSWIDRLRRRLRR